LVKPVVAFWAADFGKVTDDAFSFLTVAHGYAASPVERGGYLGSGFLRRYMRDSHQIAVCFGDADSHHLCRVSFRVDIGGKAGERSLAELLDRRYPEFVHPTQADLSKELTPEAIIREYAELVHKYAMDVVEGDLTGFRR